MKLKDISKEDLEAMTYGEITEVILSEKGGKLKIVDIFQKICKALELSEKEFENKIADYFELISTDKTFIVLDKGYCDLRKKHTPQMMLEEDEEEHEVEDVEEESDEMLEKENEETDIFYDNSSDEDDVEDDSDELTDFIVVDEDETSM